MTPEHLHRLCMAMPGAHQEQPFPRHPSTTVYKVGGKIFALTSSESDPLTVSLKCDPAFAVRLRHDHPGTVVGGYHLNKRHWNTVTLDGSLPEEQRMVKQLVEDSYDLVAEGLPRAARAALEHGVDPVNGRRITDS